MRKTILARETLVGELDENFSSRKRLLHKFEMEDARAREKERPKGALCATLERKIYLHAGAAFARMRSEEGISLPRAESAALLIKLYIRTRRRRINPLQLTHDHYRQGLFRGMPTLAAQFARIAPSPSLCRHSFVRAAAMVSRGSAGKGR